MTGALGELVRVPDGELVCPLRDFSGAGILNGLVVSVVVDEAAAFRGNACAVITMRDVVRSSVVILAMAVCKGAD